MLGFDRIIILTLTLIIIVITVTVEDYSELRHSDPPSVSSQELQQTLQQEFYCCEGSETWCQYRPATPQQQTHLPGTNHTKVT